MPIGTAEGYKAYRGHTGSDYDARTAVAIGAVEAKVRRLCGRDESNGFEQALRTHVLSGDGTGRLYLPEWPVDSITSVKFRTSSTAGAPVFGETLDGGSYVYNDRGVVTRTSVGGWGDECTSVWPDGNANIQVVCTAGYATLPDDLKLACFILIDAWFADVGHDVISTNQASMGVVNRAFATRAEVVERVTGLVSPWRRGFAS
mgnify:CR=1 FL=1